MGTGRTSTETGAVEAITRRVEDRTEEIADRLLIRYYEEIPDYRALSQPAKNDVRATAVALLDDLIALVRSPDATNLDSWLQFRQSAARRIHQGVSMHSLLRSYRIWQEVVWQEFELQAKTSAERDAALHIAEQLMAHVNAGSTMVAHAYLDALTDVGSGKDQLRRDLLDALIVGHLTDHQRRESEAVLDFEVPCVVVIARFRDPARMVDGSMRQTVDAFRHAMQTIDPGWCIGTADSETVAFVPARQPVLSYALEERANGLASELPDHVVGIGRRHAGIDGIQTSYAEAAQAVEIGVITEQTDRAIAFSDVLLHGLLRKSIYSSALFDETIAPLLAYDEARQASLVETLKAYFESGFSLTTSAAKLYVHPNTVSYRLGRIGELTGREPTKPKDLLLLLLGLQLLEFGEA